LKKKKYKAKAPMSTTIGTAYLAMLLNISFLSLALIASILA